MWSRRPSPSRRSRWFSAVVSGTLDLLDGPQVAIRILKEDVGRAHRSLGPELLDIAGWDTAPGERLPRGIDVLDHQLDTLDRAGFAERQTLADHKRAGRAGGRHLHYAGIGTTSSFISMMVAVRFEMSCAPPCSLKGEDGGLEAWSGRRDSNSRPLAWEASALPTELLPLGQPDFSIALSQFLAHRPNDHDQLRDTRGDPLDLGGVEDLDRIGFVEPDPATIPGLEVELLAQARLDHQ